MKFKYSEIMNKLHSVDYLQALYDIKRTCSGNLAIFNQKIAQRNLGVPINVAIYEALSDIYEYTAEVIVKERENSISEYITYGHSTSAHADMESGLNVLIEACEQRYIRDVEVKDLNEYDVFYGLYASFHKVASILDPKGAFETVVSNAYDGALEDLLNNDAALELTHGNQQTPSVIHIIKDGVKHNVAISHLTWKYDILEFRNFILDIVTTYGYVKNSLMALETK